MWNKFLFFLPLSYCSWLIPCSIVLIAKPDTKHFTRSMWTRPLRNTCRNRCLYAYSICHINDSELILHKNPTNALIYVNVSRIFMYIGVISARIWTRRSLSMPDKLRACTRRGSLSRSFNITKFQVYNFMVVKLTYCIILIFNHSSEGDAIPSLTCWTCVSLF
jgi:hypothetical protein